jgi:hypothetical protein
MGFISLPHAERDAAEGHKAVVVDFNVLCILYQQPMIPIHALENK